MKEDYNSKDLFKFIVKFQYSSKVITYQAVIIKKRSFQKNEENEERNIKSVNLILGLLNIMWF